MGGWKLLYYAPKIYYYSFWGGYVHNTNLTFWVGLQSVTKVHLATSAVLCSHVQWSLMCVKNGIKCSNFGLGIRVFMLFVSL